MRQPLSRVCIKLELIAGNVLFVDGTKIRSNAARNRSHDRTYYEKLLNKLDGRIKQLLDDCEAADRSEEGSPSFVAMDKELAKSQNLKDRIKEALSCFAPEQKKQVNQTDPDCAVMHGIQGGHAACNVQSVVDNQHGLIVQAEAVSDPSDAHQFSRQIEQANDVLGKSCEVDCADAGYSDVSDLEKIDGKNIKFIVPSQRQALHEFVFLKTITTQSLDPGTICRVSRFESGY